MFDSHMLSLFSLSLKSHNCHPTGHLVPTQMHNKRKKKIKPAASVGSTYKFVVKGIRVVSLVHWFNLEACKMQKCSSQIHLFFSNKQIQRPHEQDNDEVSLVFVTQETAPIIFSFFNRQGNKTNTVL